MSSAYRPNALLMGQTGSLGGGEGGYWFIFNLTPQPSTGDMLGRALDKSSDLSKNLIHASKPAARNNRRGLSLLGWVEGGGR